MSKFSKSGLTCMAAIFGATLLFSQPSSGAGRDGATIFKVRCSSCHSLDEGKNRTGPSLAGIVGQTAGTVEGYRYSKLLKAAGKAGLTWNPNNLATYFANPKKFLRTYLKEQGKPAPGGSKMTFRLKKPTQAKAVANYLSGL